MIIDGQKLTVIVEHKKIKNIYFRINDDGNILVTCSKSVSSSELFRLLEKNQKGIEKMYRKFLLNHKSNNKILFLGKELEFVQNSKIMFKDNIAYGPSIERINEYLEKRSLKYFEDRLKLYIDSFDDLPEFRLRIRKMKSRWGVCNKSSMTITLNSLLIHKRYFLIDYVIVHELSHFHHMDHSKEFWKCVEEHYPKYKQARKELNG